MIISIPEFPSDIEGIKHYLMESTAEWNGNTKKCYGYCFEDKDDSNKPRCMCNPSLMEDKNYTLLAGKKARLSKLTN